MDAHDLGISHQVMDVLLGDLVVWSGLVSSPPLPASSVLDLILRSKPSSWLMGWGRIFLVGTQVGLGWSCVKTQAKFLPIVKKKCGLIHIPSKGLRLCARMGGVIPGVC